MVPHFHAVPELNPGWQLEQFSFDGGGNCFENVQEARVCELRRPVAPDETWVAGL
jgi:hypothetical protein